MPRFRHIPALAALALAASPIAGGASSTGTLYDIVTGSGNQTQPSIDGQYVVYSGPAASPADGTDVFVYDLVKGTIGLVASGPGDQDSPDTFGTMVAYRTLAGIGIRDWFYQSDLRLPDGARDTAHPTIGGAVAAWELGALQRDIVLMSLEDGREMGVGSNGAVAVPGDQHSPAARGSVVAWVDEADSAAGWWLDSRISGSATRIGPTLVSPGGIALGEYRKELVAAVTHREDGVHDDDVEVWGPAASGAPGYVEIAALHVPGLQRNPHVSADWAAFEDLSTGHSQVVLWRWVDGPDGVVFVPHPSPGDQILNDLYVAEGTHVRVVFADDERGDLDIALYDLVVSAESPDGGAVTDWPPKPPPPPPPPPPPEATCDDLAGSTVLATLRLSREGQKPAALTEPFDVPDTEDGIMPVLVCIETDGVSSGWVTLDDEAIARPSSFDPAVTHLAIQHAVHGRSAQISGVIAGQPGATLTAYVLADPARGAASAGAGGAAIQRLPDSAAGSGCGSGGASGPGSLAVLAALAALRAVARRRRA